MLNNNIGFSKSWKNFDGTREEPNPYVLTDYQNNEGGASTTGSITTLVGQPINLISTTPTKPTKPLGLNSLLNTNQNNVLVKPLLTTGSITETPIKSEVTNQTGSTTTTPNLIGGIIGGGGSSSGSNSDSSLFDKYKKHWWILLVVAAGGYAYYKSKK